MNKQKRGEFMRRTGKSWAIACGIAGLSLAIMMQVYGMFNLLSNDKGALILFYNTLVGAQTQAYKETLIESIQFKVQDVLNPLKLLYQTLPYYKNKSIVMGVYQEELGGYFEMPSKEELVALEEKIYTITIPKVKEQKIDTTLLSDNDYLRSHIFSAKKAVSPEDDLLDLWDFEAMATQELTINEQIQGPKVLIFHTHIKEAYRTSNKEEIVTVSDVAEELGRLLEEDYGLETLHVTEDFYPTLDSTDTTGNYERIEEPIRQVLEDNPSIQIVIDLHRDGLKDHVHLVGDVDGKQTAQMMIANGLCMSRNADGELIPMKYLQNPYLEENLTFAIQMQLAGMEYYPEMMRKMYLMDYRYSTHMAPYSILIELGAQTNTAEEAMNAVAPIAHMIGKVFQKD